MVQNKTSFIKEQVLHRLEHFLPSQAPLKDFIHHNTLHAFQGKPFHEALSKASSLFGYNVYLSLTEYRTLFSGKLIDELVLDRIISKYHKDDLPLWKDRLINDQVVEEPQACVGQLKALWKEHYHLDLDSLVHPTLFRIIGSYLDQGVSIWNFPTHEDGFLASIRDLESNSSVSFFRQQRARVLLLKEDISLIELLEIVVGNESLYEHYLFDQQFAHPGWSGIVSVIGTNPDLLIDKKTIDLQELICFELLLEIDALDDHFGEVWAPIGLKAQHIEPLNFEIDDAPSDSMELKKIWQEAYEWSYYDTVLRGLQLGSKELDDNRHPSFQGIFCIDDRECSIRRHLENQDPKCKTYGTAGFFNVEFYFQPEHSKFRTKVCPAPVTPKYLIRELENKQKIKSDFHFGKQSHGLLAGWIITHTLGFWSAFRLFFTVFRPSAISSTVSSFQHMDENSQLTVENIDNEMSEDGLQIGYTLIEMADRLEGLLRSIGLTGNFAPLVYVIGHGSSSVNNTHYAGYDCGACSGRPGSVNARVLAHIGNDQRVRGILTERGIVIPETTHFIGALHDTSRDEIRYYDLKLLSEVNALRHEDNNQVFHRALSDNAKERSRRFMLINTKDAVKNVHEKVKLRTVSLFEPRPELNHATNTLCIVGRREFSDSVFLDRRSFLNSYDHTKDPEGKYLLNILNAVAPVCGGINLEYYFSRVDNQRLGAGTKLPHNVMGLIGVANGMEGDLRTGLPSQMIEVHDPLRLLVIVEQDPEIVLNVIRRNAATFEWFANEWVHLAAVDPESRDIFVFNGVNFDGYEPSSKDIPVTDNILSLIESTHENIPVHLLKKKVHGNVH
jgi:uncharacterized protein